MCIPIELDIPVVAADQRSVGTAREITCPCPGDHADDGMIDTHGGSSQASSDLWLRVERPAQTDLYIPFVEIAETRPDGVCLRASYEELEEQHWERLPAGFPEPAAVA
jgi:hypothetical protein